MRHLKQSFKAFFVTIVMLCCSMMVFAQPVEIDGIYYELYNGWSTGYYDANGNWQSTPYYQYAAFVTNSNGNGGDYSGDIQIPETVNDSGIDYTVVKVNYAAFRSCPSLTSVELPSTIVWIEGDAFYQCI